MEVMVTTGAIRRAKLQSNHRCQQTNTQLFTGQMPFLSHNQQCQSTEGKLKKTEPVKQKPKVVFIFLRERTYRVCTVFAVQFHCDRRDVCDELGVRHQHDVAADEERIS